MDVRGYAKRVARILHTGDLGNPQIRREGLPLGNEGARWFVCTGSLIPSSVVYSFGVGQDISFDLELIHRFGVRVHAFDPTPKSIEWLRTQVLPTNFDFHPYGVADFEGTCKFFAPNNPAHVSHSIIERDTPWPAIGLPVHRLPTIMKMLGHERIDLLKMDIEGAEYAVISDLLVCGLRVNQLLVEFHHRWKEIGRERTKRAVRDLNKAGFRIFSVSPGGEEYSLVRV
jgi:FkbM family methyltransferase